MIRLWPALLAGCSARVIEVDLSGSTADLAFFVSITGGQITRVSPPFGLEAGRVVHGAVPDVALGEPDDVIYVELTAADLSAALPTFVPERIAESAVEIRAPPAGAPYASLDRPYARRVRIPATAGAYTVCPGYQTRDQLEAADPADVELLSERLTLVLGVDPDRCAPSIALRPFGDEPNVIRDADGFLVDRIYRSVWVPGMGGGPDRAVLAVGAQLAIVPAGGNALGATFTSTRGPSTRFPLVGADDPCCTDGQFSGLAIDFDPARPDRRRLIAAGSGHRRDRPSELVGVVLEMELTEAGFEHVRTATIIENADFRDVAITSLGATAINGLGGLSLVFDRESSALRRRDVPDPTASWNVVPTDDRRRPFLAGATNRLYLFDPETGTWIEERIVEPGLTPLLAQSLASVFGEGLELWAGGNLGRLFAGSPGSGIQRFRVDYPPSFLPCADPESGLEGIVSIRDFLSSTIAGGYLFATIAKCTAPIAIELATGCATVLDTGEPVIPIGQSLLSASSRDGRVLFSGGRGRLFIGELSP